MAHALQCHQSQLAPLTLHDLFFYNTSIIIITIIALNVQLAKCLHVSLFAHKKVLFDVAKGNEK